MYYYYTVVSPVKKCPKMTSTPCNLLPENVHSSKRSTGKLVLPSLQYVIVAMTLHCIYHPHTP